MSEFLDDRRRSLEEAFFAKQNKQLLDKMRQKAEAEELAQALSEASGITDQEVLGHLVAAGVHAESAAALALVPLVEVAWADGKMEKSERRAILSAAEESGIATDSASHELLESWLDVRPEPSLLDSWKEYAGELAKSLSTEAAAALKKQVLGRAREVARSAGGLLGLASISFVEEKKLEELARAFE